MAQDVPEADPLDLSQVDTPVDFTDGQSAYGWTFASCCEGECDNPWNVGGWLAQGFTWNPSNPVDRFNGPLTFNDRANEYQLNQAYLVVERCATDMHCGWGVGGRVDLLYGTDYFFTTSLGLETHTDGTPRWNPASGPRRAGSPVASPASLYGLAMPQLYAEFLTPLFGGTQFLAGHFYTPLGYEQVPAVNNFFYSHSYTMQYGEPFTHTGVLATKHCGDWLTLRGGVVNGWDAWEDTNDKASGLLGAQYCGDLQSLSFNICFGPEDDAGENNRTVYSLVYTRELSPCWCYVFQHDLGTEENAAANSTFSVIDADWWSINQYLFYNYCETLSFGCRFEYFCDDDNARVLSIPLAETVDGSSYTELTFGANWRPRCNVVVRPEIRWDWSNVRATQLGIDGMFDDFSSKNQLTVALDVIAVF
jgi:hypothetical protein